MNFEPKFPSAFAPFHTEDSNKNAAKICKYIYAIGQDTTYNI